MSKISSIYFFNFTFFILLSGFQTQAQKLLKSSRGEISFYSDTPLEAITASNKKVFAVLNLEKKELAVKFNIKDFEFPNRLMQTHFNESYLESDKFPSASFSGKFEDDFFLSNDGIQEIHISGYLTVHGVKVFRKLKISLVSLDNHFHFSCNFFINYADHKIEVPNLVFARISDQIQVRSKFDFSLSSVQ